MPSRHCLNETSKSCEYSLFIFRRDSQTFRVNRGKENTLTRLHYFNINRRIALLPKVPTTEHLQALTDPLSERLHLLPLKVLLCVCVCVCACVCFHAHAQSCFFVTPWTRAYQAPLPMKFPRQEYWSELPFLPPVGLSNPGIKPTTLVSPALVGGFFTTSATWDEITLFCECVSKSRLVVSDSLQCHGLYSMPGSFVHEIFQNTEVGSHSLLRGGGRGRGIFPTQRWNSDLLLCRRIPYHLSHQGSPLYFVIISKTQKL